jgi:membrane-bound ClpP family serine protease
MSPALLIFALFAAAAVFWIAELMLPMQGLLGVLGSGAIIAAIVVGFRINQWLGLSMLLGVLILSPFVAALVVNIWPRTPIGRLLLLPRVHSVVVPPHVGVGQIGVTVSELRPVGCGEFNQQRFEVKSEAGLIPPGSRIKVVNILNGKLIVRPT